MTAKTESKGAPYKLHPICRMFPRMQGDEYNAFKSNIRINGLREAALTKEQYVLDGQNRMNVVRDLINEGAVHPKTGQAWTWEDFPTTEYQGEMDDAVAEIEGRNLARRHLTSSQKAAVAVSLAEMYKKLQKRGRKFTDAMGQPIDEITDLAEYVAYRVGTNRTYVFKAMALNEKYSDLLEKVRDGQLTLGQAEAEAKKREAARDGDGDGEKKDDGKGEEQKEEPALLDGLGQTVPDKYRAVFATVDQFNAVIKNIRGCKGQVTGVLTDSAGAAHLDHKTVASYLEAAAKMLNGQKPFTLCTLCKGETCEACGHAGWITKVQHKAQLDKLAEDQANAAKGAEAREDIAAEKAKDEEAKGDGKGKKSKKSKKAEAAPAEVEVTPEAAPESAPEAVPEGDAYIESTDVSAALEEAAAG